MFGGRSEDGAASDSEGSETYNELQGNSRDGFKRVVDNPDSDEIGLIEVKPQRLEITADGALEERLLVRREGWMYKKGGTVNRRGGAAGGGRKNWRKRWFVLAEVPFRGQKGYELRYYDRPKGALKGSVGLSEVTIYCESTQKRGDKRLNLVKKFEYQLQLPHGGSLQLSCDQPEEREEWIETINIIIAYLRLLTHPELAMVINGYDPMNEEDADVYKQGEEIAQNCQCYGPGLFGAEAGQQGQFVLEIHDIDGEPVSRGGMPVTCTISSDDLLYYVSLTDNENGSYSGFYTLSTPGKYQLSIRLNDEHEVFGSPYEIQILPSKTVASKSVAEGVSLREALPNVPSTFTIHACDSYGNRKARGGDQFEVGIMGPAQLMSLHDNLDGSYVCTFEAQDPTTLNYHAPSSLMIVVTLHGKPIHGSPFRPIILDAPAPARPQKPASVHSQRGSASYAAAPESAFELAMAAMSHEPARPTAAATAAAATPVSAPLAKPSPAAEHKDREQRDARQALAGAESSFVDDAAPAPSKAPSAQSSVNDKSASRLERARASANRAKALLG
jgi:hypothetical protein